MLETRDLHQDMQFSPLSLVVLGMSKMPHDGDLEPYSLHANSPDACGRTPLIWAAMREDEKWVEILLQWCGDPRWKDNDGDTALHHVARRGCCQIAQLLLDAGAEVNSRNDLGSTPLIEATSWPSGNKDMVLLLLQNGAEINSAAWNTGCTALHAAAFIHNFANAQVLLSAGADMELRNCWGNTPLICAMYQNNPKLVRLLLKHGARLDVHNATGRGVLGWVARYGTVETMALFTQLQIKGIDPNDADAENLTP